MQIPSRRFVRLLGFLLAIAPMAAHGQSQGKPPGAGWGSDWTQPANEQQRQRREFNLQAQNLAKAHDYKGLLDFCTRSMPKDPEASGLYVVRAAAYAELKQYDRAMADLDHAQAMTEKLHQPVVSARLLLARSELDQRRRDYPAAVDDLQASLKLDDKSAWAWNNVAWLRATAPVNGLRDGREGIREAQKAIALAGNERSWGPIDTLAAAYAEANDYPQAIESEKRALNLVGTKVKDAARARKLQDQMTTRLRLYEQHRPYHADTPTES